MADTFSAEERSRIMAKIHGKDTRPEKIVRSLIHRLGYRFRLHRVDLPGKPDIVLPRLRKVIFVHGCFWHGHKGCKRAKRPATNTEFWNKKIDRNIERDKQNLSDLENAGWKCLVIWGCELRDLDKMSKIIKKFLES